MPQIRTFFAGATKMAAALAAVFALTGNSEPVSSSDLMKLPLARLTWLNQMVQSAW